MKLQLTPARRIHLVGLQVIIILLIPFWLFKLFHYYFLPMPIFFSSPSMIPSQNQPALQNSSDIDYKQTLINMSYFLVFWVQHIIMASFKWKTFLTNLFPAYPFYERLFYNIISSILVFWVIDIQIPQNYILFELPWFTCVPLGVLGFWLYVDSNLQLSESLMTPYSFTKLMQQKYLQKREITEVQQKGIFITGSYRWIRHPMQAGLIFLFTFGNWVFTFEKIIMMVVYFGMVMWGVLLEEKRLIQKYTQYKEYMQQIRYRFIPYVI